jgi:hypothetical protein
MDMISSALHCVSARRRQAAFRRPCGDDFGGSPALAGGGAYPRRKSLLAASAAILSFNERRAILRAFGDVAGQVGVHRNAELNVALALFGGDNETVFR